jgi:tRNA G37 N-methylase TrmD
MKAEPILKAWEKAVGRKKDQTKVKTLIMSPRGAVFSQARAKEYASTTTTSCSSAAATRVSIRG